MLNSYRYLMKWPTVHKYQNVDSGKVYHRQHSSRKMMTAVHHFFSFGLGTALALAIIYFSLRRHLPSSGYDTHQINRPLRGCGTTPGEARAAGCIFDMLTVAWTPSECVDPDLTREFLELEDWKYYKDKEGTEQVALAELTAGDWDGIHYATMGGPPVDTLLGSKVHTTHCQEMIMKNDSDRITGRQEVFYREC
ncbi:uncharacterized protein BHQ10_008387 [Talaromyces amestolkiae]|uniref:Uncharacterized protein n=1 Tax=Talaromyces amestolkiae TaxID=1196081 RepID=A0A364L980_TALAM|nr:uncharacterized protein BHQ10_008387 [Talaromyces amestolkiae]RAO72375.1 hypothetical protein BHQ10_008387 [Talaromyces amestolkiae]